MTRRYASAGAVVVTIDGTEPRTLLLDQRRVTGERQTVAPKGGIEPGEGPLAAAVREVTEEAGLIGLTYAGYLGQEIYRFTDNDGTPAAKTVAWFLLAAGSTVTQPRVAEGFISARWLTFDRAAQTASHPSFVHHLHRAADVIAWRRSGALPFSAVLDSVVRDIAAAAQPLLDGEPGAGIAVCGSTARGDFVDGWSDIDLIGYGLPAGSPTIAALTALVRDTASRHAVRASLHLAKDDGRSLCDTGPLYDMKLQATLQRIGTDVAIIAGTAPTSLPAMRDHTELLPGLAALRDFATSRLATPEVDTETRKDRARRTLSAACSAARTIALTIDPDTDLRLPAVTDVLDRHHPGASIVPLLREYDSFRRLGAGDLNEAERLAEQAPHAIDDLIQRHHSPAPTSG